MVTAAELEVLVSARDQASATLRSVSGSIQETEKHAGGLAGALKGLMGGVASVAGGIAAANIGGALIGQMKGGVQAAGDLQQAVANISTIKPEIDTSQVFGALNEMSRRVPQTAAQLGSSLYDIFSSMEVTQGEALKLVETFSKGAVGAGTDAQTFGTSIVGVMNAYKLSAADASHVSDVFFNTVNKGVITGQELASSLGPVTQSAKSAGVSLDELGALIAGVTKEGGPAAQNVNNLNNTLQKITTKDAQKAIQDLGVKTKTSTGDFRPIIDVLGDMKPKLEGMTESARANALQTIFPDAQARQGAATLISQLDMVKDALKSNQEATGTTEAAYKKMAATFNSQAAILKNTLTSIGVEAGAKLLPMVTPLITAFSEHLPGAIATAGAAISKLTAPLSVLAEWIGKVFHGQVVGDELLAKFVALPKPIQELAGKIVDLGVAFTRLDDYAKAWASGLMNTVRPLVSGLASGLMEGVKAAGPAFAQLADVVGNDIIPRLIMLGAVIGARLGPAIGEMASVAVPLLVSGLTDIARVIASALDRILLFFEAIDRGDKSSRALWDGLKLLAGGLAALYIVDKVAGGFNDLVEGMANATKAGRTFLDILNPMAGETAKAAGHLRDMANAAQSMAQSVGTAVRGPLAGGIMQAAMAIDDLKAKMSSLGSKAISLSVDGITTAWDAIHGIASTLAGMKDKAIKFAIDGVEAAQSALDGITSKLGSLATEKLIKVRVNTDMASEGQKGASSFTSGFLGGLGGGAAAKGELTAATATAGGIGLTIGAGVAAEAYTGWTAALAAKKGDWAQAIGRALSAAPQLGAGFGTVFSDLFAKIGIDKALAPLRAKVGSALGSLFSDAGGAGAGGIGKLGQIFGSVASAAQSAGSAISSGFSAALSATGSIITSIGGALANLGGQAAAAGAAVMRGIVDGIKAAPGLAIEGAGALAGFIVVGLYESIKSGVHLVQWIFETAGDVASQAATIGVQIGSGIKSGISTAGDIGASILSTLAAVPGQVGSILASIGGTIQTALSAIPGFISGIASQIGSLFSSVASTIGDALSAVPGLLADIGGQIGSALSAIPGILGDIAGQIGSALSEMPGLLGDLAGQVGDALSAIPGLAEDAAGQIVDVLSGIPDQLGNLASLLGDAFSVAWDTLSSGAEDAASATLDVLRGIPDGLGDLESLIADAASAGWDALSSGAEDAVSAIGDVLSGIPDVASSAMSAVGSVISDAFHGAVGLISDIPGAIGSLFDSARDAVSGAVSGVVGIVGTAFSNARDAVSTAMGEIVSAISNSPIGEAARAGISFVVDHFKTGFNEVNQITHGELAKAQQAFSDGMSMIATVVSSGISTIAKIFRGIGDAIGDLSGLLTDAGRQVISGFVSGIRSAFDSVRSTLGELTSLIPSWKGPSDKDIALLRPAGQMIIEGLIDGFEDGYPDVRDSLGTVTDSIVGTVVGSFAAIRDPAAHAVGSFMAVHRAATDLNDVLAFTPPVVSAAAASLAGLFDPAARKTAQDLAGLDVALADLKVQLSNTNAYSAQRTAIEEQIKFLEGWKNQITSVRDAQTALQKSLELSRTALDGFNQAAATAATSKANTASFGAGGADIIGQLTKAVQSDSPDAGAAVFAGFDKLIASLKGKMPDLQAVYEQGARLFANVFTEHTPESVQAVMNYLGSINAALQAQTALTAENFAAGMQRAIGAQALSDALGSSIGGAFTSLQTALDNGGTGALDAAVKLGTSVQAELAKLPEFVRGQLGTDFSIAMQAVIANPTAETVAAAQAAALQIHAALGVIPSGFADMLPQVQGAVQVFVAGMQSGALSAEDAKARIAAVTRGIPADFAELPPAVQGALALLTVELENGALTVEQYQKRVAAAVALVPKDWDLLPDAVQGAMSRIESALTSGAISARDSGRLMSEVTKIMGQDFKNLDGAVNDHVSAIVEAVLSGQLTVAQGLSAIAGQAAWATEQIRQQAEAVKAVQAEMQAAAEWFKANGFGQAYPGPGAAGSGGKSTTPGNGLTGGSYSGGATPDNPYPANWETVGRYKAPPLEPVYSGAFPLGMSPVTPMGYAATPATGNQSAPLTEHGIASALIQALLAAGIKVEMDGDKVAKLVSDRIGFNAQLATQAGVGSGNGY